LVEIPPAIFFVCPDSLIFDQKWTCLIFFAGFDYVKIDGYRICS